MAFELHQGVAPYYDQNFTVPDFGEILDRKRRRELAERQLNQQADLARQNREERAREFNMRGAEWGGEDTVMGPDGVFDPVATSLARKRRTDAEALAQAAGSNSVWAAPTAPPEKFMSPEMLNAATATGESPAPAIVEPTQEQLNDPHFARTRAEALKIKGQEAFQLDKAHQAAEAAFQRGMAVAGLRNQAQLGKFDRTVTQKLVDDLQRNDPGFDQSKYDLTNQDDLNELRDRHNQVMSKINTQKRMGMAGRIASMSDEDLAAEGFAPEVIRNIREAASGANRMTGLQKNTAAYEKRLRDAAIATGQPVDEADVQARVRKYVENGGKIPQLVPAVKKDMDESAATIDTLDTLLGGVNAFNQKYGRDAFDSYLGWLPKNKIQIENAIRKTTDPKDTEALQLLGQFAGMRNGVLKGTSGQAVTESEAKRMAQQIGDSGDKNSLTKLAQFRTDTARRLAGAIKRNAEYQLPKYYEDWIASESGGKGITLPTELGGHSAAPTALPAGWKFEP
jgi:hypothetical protein